ncbi:MAG: hypothetical protein NTU83_02475 [Candidatus Hydrogenedentes bacterium]|nr:hypothetical protein [Candidatus Hydrogenedentota bacterium]
MKKSIALLIVAATVALAVPAFAELQNVVVGGEIRIRTNWFSFGSENAVLAGRDWVWDANGNCIPVNIWDPKSLTSNAFAEPRRFHGQRQRVHRTGQLRRLG